MDSATLVGVSIANGRQVESVFFQYGSKHNPWELDAAHEIANHYGIPFDVLDITNVGKLLQSNLLVEGGEIPEGHYEAPTMAQTVVPGRNSIFIAILTGIADSRGAREVAVGIHSGDHAIYPDCRPEYFYEMRRAMGIASENRVILTAPFLHGDKTSIIKSGLDIGVPYGKTRTCYKAQAIACGKCGSCQERLEAFRNNGIEDPVEYETREALAK
jgi:7-cyano-7-deazaguanine synthase